MTPERKRLGDKFQCQPRPHQPTMGRKAHLSSWVFHILFYLNSFLEGFLMSYGKSLLASPASQQFPRNVYITLKLQRGPPHPNATQPLLRTSEFVIRLRRCCGPCSLISPLQFLAICFLLTSIWYHFLSQINLLTTPQSLFF